MPTLRRIQILLNGIQKGLQRISRLCRMAPAWRLKLPIPIYELAMQDVVTAAHKPKSRPIGDRHDNHAKNTDLKHAVRARLSD